MKHICSEHNQEAGRRNISKGKTHLQHGKRYVVSGMEASKTMARAAAESLSKGWTQTWVTISWTAVPLKVGAPMAAEVLVVCLLTGVLDLILCKSFSVQKNINQRIDRIFHS